MSTPTPLIDVVIPAYNAGCFISDTLNSVANQDIVINTIFVVNDGSTDDTQIKIEQFQANNPKINIVLINQANAGLSAARNAGVKQSQAEFIALLDADDIWLSDKLSSQMKIFTANHNPKLGVVYCGYRLIDNQGHFLPSLRKAVITPQLRGSIYKYLLTGNFISGSGSSVLIKRSVLNEVGLFDEALPACEDWDLWLRISQKFDFDFTHKDLVLIRVHQNNMQKDSMRMISAEMRLLNKFVERGEKNSFLLWKLRTFIANKGITAYVIPGYENCSPNLRVLLHGWRMSFSRSLLLPLRLISQIILKAINRER